MISTTELRDFTSRLHADHQFDPDFRSLTDLSAATEVDVTESALKSTAWMPLFSAGARRAIVAPSDLTYGIGRMYAVHAARFDGNVEVFRTVEEAEEWLGLQQTSLNGE